MSTQDAVEYSEDEKTFNEFDIMQSFKPEDFLNNTKKHMLLLYERLEYANAIMYQFIKNGLEKNQSCIYAMNEEAKIVEKNMSNFGIDVDRFKEENLLHIYQIEPITNFENIIEIGKNTLKHIMTDSKPPYRIVSRIVPQINTNEGIMAEIKLEKWFQSEFSSFNGVFLCPYQMIEIEAVKFKQWVQELIDNHHIVIISPPFGNGFAFERDVMNQNTESIIDKRKTFTE